MKFRTLMTSLVMAFAAIFTSAANAATVGVNFVGGQNGPNGAGTVSAVVPTGAVPTLNWNNIAGGTGAATALITNELGAGGTLTHTPTNTWAATGVTPAGNGSAAMMSGYLDNMSGDTITVTGLPASVTTAGYSVIVYFNADNASVQGYRGTDNLANTDIAFGRQVGGAGTNFPLAGPNGFIVSTDTTNSGSTLASNAVLLEGFFGSTLTILGVQGGALDGRVRPNGFQIIGNPIIPEPASMSLLALGGLALARRRRTA